MAPRPTSSFQFQLGLQYSALASNDLLTANPSLLSPHSPPLLALLTNTSFSKPFISEVANWQPGDPATDSFCLALKRVGLFLFV